MTVASGGGTEIIGDGRGLNHPVISAGALATLIVSSGGLTANPIISSGGTEIVSSSGNATDSIILAGGKVIVSAGGTGSNFTASGGLLEVASDGVANNVTLGSGGTLAIDAGGQVGARSNLGFRPRCRSTAPRYRATSSEALSRATLSTFPLSAMSTAATPTWTIGLIY